MKHTNNHASQCSKNGFTASAIVYTFTKTAGLAAMFTLVLSMALIVVGQFSYEMQIDYNESFVEWLQFAVILGGAIILALRSERKGLWLRMLVVTALLVLAMEEIDWAQPYLGYTPLAFFANNNQYGQMALHNSFGLENYLRILILFCLTSGGTVLLSLVFLKRGVQGLHDYMRRILFWPGVLIASGILAMIAGRLLHPGAFFQFDELGELAIYAGMVWFILSRPFAVLAPAER